jgi:MFS superfamily sulfate permease-like transporter
MLPAWQGVMRWFAMLVPVIVLVLLVGVRWLAVTVPLTLLVLLLAIVILLGMVMPGRCGSSAAKRSSLIADLITELASTSRR